MIKIQFNKHQRIARRFEDYSMCPRKVIPVNRVPQLIDLVQQVTTGRPIDNSVIRNLEYNLYERLPIFEKGLDLADLSRIAKEAGKTLAQVQEEVDRAKANAEGKNNLVQSPVQDPPQSVATE